MMITIMMMLKKEKWSRNYQHHRRSLYQHISHQSLSFHSECNNCEAAPMQGRNKHHEYHSLTGSKATLQRAFQVKWMDEDNLSLTVNERGGGGGGVHKTSGDKTLFTSGGVLFFSFRCASQTGKLSIFYFFIFS